MVTTLTVSAAGDVTLGGDIRQMGYHAFMRLYNEVERDLSWFLRYTRPIFEQSDLSIVNLEGTLTDETNHRDREFVFRAPPHFARILTYGAVDVVSIANNHTMDYHLQGYLDTIAALEAEGIAYFGNEFNTILEVNGIKVGLFGFSLWHDSIHNRSLITNAIADLQGRGAQLIIAYHHWGEMRVHIPNETQRILGQFTIDSGAHLVLGAHPHCIQGIEEYNGYYIVYSLGDFCYGGHANPSDQAAFIFQQTFTFIDGELQHTNDTNIIPIFISSTRSYNNFQPKPAESSDAERIIERIQYYSGWLK
jgi:poly-gamma-glutamate synthesis protein (capsule biosynthesis protein)